MEESKISDGQAPVPGEPSPSNRTGLLAVCALAAVGITIAAAFLLQMDGKRAVPLDGTPEGKNSAAIKELASKIQPAVTASTEPCGRELEEIRKLYATFPEDYREAKNLERLRSGMVACRDRCAAFISKCPADPNLYEVKFMLARLKLSLNQVEWVSLVTAKTSAGMPNAEIPKLKIEWMAGYFGEVLDLASSALPKYGAGTPERARCLELLGDALSQKGEPQKALGRFEELLAEYPKYGKLANVLLAMARCQQDLGNFPTAAATIRKGMADLPNDPSFPYFLETLWQIGISAGDLPGLLLAVEAMRSVLPERMKRAEIGAIEKDICDRSLAYSGFRLGYIRFALGDHALAGDAFREHIAYLDSLTKSRGQIPQDYTVYQGRSRENLEVLEGKIGKRMPADLDAIRWAGERRLELRGRPIAIVFRSWGDDRSAPFLQALDRHARGRRDAFELASISYLKAADSPEAQAEEVLAEAKALGIECPVGLDPDAAGKRIFKAFDATVGSATFVILDGSGNYVWFQQDPRVKDDRFSTAILERIIAKGA
jgi:tetratricopeptide (TPR) repeat protein